MTIRRPPGSVHAALAQILPHLSDAELDVAGLPERNTLSKQSNPMVRSELSLENAARLDALLTAKGMAPIFGPLFLELVERCSGRIRGDGPTAINLEAGLRHVVADVGGLAKAIDRAMADGILDRQERREIAREAQEVIDDAKRIRDTVEPPAELKIVGGAA